MQSIAVPLPILNGKTDSVRKMVKTIKEEKWKEYDASQKKSGIRKERDFLVSSPMGDIYILYLESEDLNKSFMEFSASKDPFDIWVKAEFKNATGIDFNQPPSGPRPELLNAYDF